MTNERIYKPLPALTRDQVEAAIKNNDIGTLISSALSVATYDRDWKYAQDVCLRLAHHTDATIRGNAILAIGYIARVHRKLEKHVVEPVLLRARRDPEAWVRARAEDAIDDVNLYMDWQIGNR